MAKSIVFFTLMLSTILSFAQKKGSELVLQSQNPSVQQLSVSETEIRRRIVADMGSRTTNSSSCGKYDGLETAPRNLGISLVEFEKRYSTIQRFYLDKNTLLNLIYNPQTDPSDKISGFWILFTNKPNEIVIVAGNTDGKRFSNNYQIINASTSKVTSSASSLMSIDAITKKFNSSPIKGYFIGRATLIEHLAGRDGAVSSNFSQLEIDVRKNDQSQYVLILRKNSWKIADSFIGIAYSSETTKISDDGKGMSGSRPCPPYCNN